MIELVDEEPEIEDAVVSNDSPDDVFGGPTQVRAVVAESLSDVDVERTPPESRPTAAAQETGSNQERLGFVQNLWISRDYRSASSRRRRSLLGAQSR